MLATNDAHSWRNYRNVLRVRAPVAALVARHALSRANGAERVAWMPATGASLAAAVPSNCIHRSHGCRSVRSLHIYKHYSRAERCGDLYAVTLRQRLRPLVDQLDVVASAYHALLHDGTVQPQVRAPRPQRRALPTED